jgi:hypothetical protein
VVEVEDGVAGRGVGVAAGVEGMDVVACGVDLSRKSAFMRPRCSRRQKGGGPVEGPEKEEKLTPQGYGSFFGGGFASRTL